MPDEGTEDSGESGAAVQAGWREADLKRAILAAQEAGLRGYRIEIAPDGMITIVVGGAPDEATMPDPDRDPLSP